MRFAITAIDSYQGIFEAFLAAGWSCVKLFTIPQGRDNASVVARARQLGVPVQFERMAAPDIEALHGQCDILILASYSWRIPVWQHAFPYAINFHPSPLPDGRGPYPMVRAILEARQQWAVSCHIVADAFDEGDILAVEPFALATDESLESLSLKVQMAARRLALRVATADFAALWQHAQVQGVGHYWPLWTDAERQLDFAQPVARLLRQIRAFSWLETRAVVNGMPLFVRRAVGWCELHTHRLGSVVYCTPNTVVVAVSDGYLGLIDTTSHSMLMS